MRELLFMKQQFIKISAAIAFLIIVQFSNVFAQQPKTAKEWFELGNLQNEQMQYSQAILSFSECVRLDKTAYTCFINRGVAYFNLKKHTEAISDFSEAIRLNPRATDAYNNRGISMAELENYSQAKSDFSKALEIEPNNKAAIDNLAELELILEKNKADKLNKGRIKGVVASNFNKGSEIEANVELKAIKNNAGKDLIEKISTKNGFYDIEVSFGYYLLTISAKGYRTYQTKVFIPAGSTLEWGTILERSITIPKKK